nr:MAG: hypothetical protein J07AB56_12990 [Candidatus Nanosalinarum sp. J07AB56]
MSGGSINTLRGNQAMITGAFVFVSMSEEDNLLNHTYHDCLLRGTERSDNETTLVIDTDVHRYPGKPFTLLTVVNIDDTGYINTLAGTHAHPTMSISKASVQHSDRPDKNFCLAMSFHSGERLEAHVYNFWEERVESYKDYANSVFK